MLKFKTNVLMHIFGEQQQQNVKCIILGVAWSEGNHVDFFPTLLLLDVHDVLNHFLALLGVKTIQDLIEKTGNLERTQITENPLKLYRKLEQRL